MTANTPPELALEIATRHNLLWRDVCGPGSTSEIMACRRDIARELKALKYSSRAIGKVLCKSREAVVYYLKDRADPTGLTLRERELLVAVLRMAAESYSRHGCNDFDLPESWSQAECDALRLAIHNQNGDPENHEPGRRDTMDWMLMDYFANKIEKELA